MELEEKESNIEEVLDLDNVENVSLFDTKTPDDLLKEYTDLETSNKAIEEKIANFREEHKEIFSKLDEMFSEIENNTSKQATIKEDLVGSMSESNIDSIANKMFKVKYVAETIRHDFDKTKFKDENEELYNKYIKDTKVKAYVKITEVK
jgi:hypothetical protein